MSQPPPTTSAAALLARAEARFQTTVARTAAAVAEARAQVGERVDDTLSLVQLEAELRRVQGWAASFGMRELKRQSGQLATRVRRWVDHPDLERGARDAIMASEATRLAELATERPARRLPVSARPTPGAPPEPSMGAVEVVAPSAVPDAQAASSSRREPTIEAPDVIVVQDDAHMKALLLFALEQTGLRVTTFSDGPSALDAMRRMEPGPGRPLVILDVELPGADGHDLHEALREERPDAFGFVFTAGPMSDGERLRALKGGAVDYVMRPVSLRVLLAKIPQWLAAVSAAPATPPAAERRSPLERRSPVDRRAPADRRSSVDRRRPMVFGRRGAGAA